MQCYQKTSPVTYLDITKCFFQALQAGCASFQCFLGSCPASCGFNFGHFPCCLVVCSSKTVVQTFSVQIQLLDNVLSSNLTFSLLSFKVQNCYANPDVPPCKELSWTFLTCFMYLVLSYLHINPSEGESVFLSIY